MSKTTCSKCGGRMDQGWMPDARDQGPKPTVWIAGTPKKGFLGMFKVRGLTRHDIETWRCGRCGYLESYAPA